MLTTTLCYLEKDGAYLMLHRVKKKEDTNRGKWLGLGGKIEKGESPDECVRREVLEESGISMNSATKRGVIYFISDIYPDEVMHLYTSCDFQYACSPRDDEGVLEWVPFEEIFSLNLWEGDKVFLRKLMDGEEYFELRLNYCGDTLTEVEELTDAVR